MGIDLQKALAYPYRHCLASVVVPGIVVYVDIVLTFIVLIAVIVLVAVFLALTLHSSSASQPLVAWLPKFPMKEIFTSLLQVEPFSQGAFEWLPKVLAQAASEDTLSDSKYSGSSGGFNPSGVGVRWGGLLYSLYWLGFEWQLFGKLQKDGLDAAPPEPEVHLPGFFVDGVKGALFYVPLNLMIGFLCLLPFGLLVVYGMSQSGGNFSHFDPALVIALVGCGLLVALVLFALHFFAAPFFIAPMVNSAQNREVLALYNLPDAIRLAAPRYFQLLSAFLLIGVTWILYAIGSIILCFATCCTGMLLFPFIWEGAFRVTATHLLAQAFADEPMEMSLGKSII